MWFEGQVKVTAIRFSPTPRGAGSDRCEFEQRLMDYVIFQKYSHRRGAKIAEKKVRQKIALRPLWFCGESQPSKLVHHVGDRFFQSVEGQFKHGKDLTDILDRAGIGPFLGHDWIDPDRMGEGLGDELQPLMAWHS